MIFWFASKYSCYMLLYSWNPNEHRMFVKQNNFYPIMSKVYTYFLL